MSTELATTRRLKAAPRPARPTGRYFKGKLPKGVNELASDSDEEEDAEAGEPEDVPLGGSDDDAEDSTLPALPVVRAVAAVKTMNVALKDVTVSREGKVIIAGKEETGRTERELGDCISLGRANTHIFE